MGEIEGIMTSIIAITLFSYIFGFSFLEVMCIFAFLSITIYCVIFGVVELIKLCKKCLDKNNRKSVEYDKGSNKNVSKNN